MQKEPNLGCGQRIKRWRQSQKPPLKSFQLAELLKISQGSLSDIENNKSNPSAPTVVKLIKYTNINVYWVLTGNSGEMDKGEIDQKLPTLTLNISPGQDVLIKGRE